MWIIRLGSLSLASGRSRVTDADYRQPYRFIANSLYPGGRVSWDVRGDLHPDAVDLAWAVQAVTGEVMLHLAKWAREHTGEDKLGLAGGVALNAKANMVIHYSKLFNDIFIFPAANDAGTPIGAAAWVYEHVLGGKMRRGGLGLSTSVLSMVMMRLRRWWKEEGGVRSTLVMMLMRSLTLWLRAMWLLGIRVGLSLDQEPLVIAQSLLTLGGGRCGVL